MTVKGSSNSKSQLSDSLRRLECRFAGIGAASAPADGSGQTAEAADDSGVLTATAVRTDSAAEYSFLDEVKWESWPGDESVNALACEDLFNLMLEYLRDRRKQSALERVKAAVRQRSLTQLALFMDVDQDSLGLTGRKRRRLVKLVGEAYELFQSFMYSGQHGDVRPIMIPDFIIGLSAEFDDVPGYEAPITEGGMSLPQFGAQLQGDECFEEMAAEVADEFLSFYVFDKMTPTCDELVPGMPMHTAYRIGMAYYRGEGLPLDRVRALMWLNYAAVAGDPMGRLAVAAFYEEMDCYGQNMMVSQMKLMHNMAAGALKLRQFCRKSDQNFPICGLDYVYEGQPGLMEEDLLCNYIELLGAVLNRTQRGVLPDARRWVVWGFLACIDYLEIHESPAVRTALARLSTLMPDFVSRVTGDQELCQRLGFEKKDTPRTCFDKLLQPALRQRLNYAEMLWLFSGGEGLKSQEGKRYLEDLAALGVGAAVMQLYAVAGTAADGKADGSAASESLAEKQMVKAASPEINFRDARMNLALKDSVKLQHQHIKSSPRGVEYSRLALRGGNVFAFYSLYELLRETEPALACTCLRYACEYLVPTAARQLAELKAQGQYHPLPFMQTIEKIEEMAEDNVAACVLMASLYAGGSGLMPQDQFKVIHWFRQALSVGNPAVCWELAVKYRQCFECSHDTSLIRAMGDVLGELQNYYSALVTMNGSEDDLRLRNLFLRCRSQLNEGKTWLEQELLKNSIWHGFWADHAHIFKYDGKEGAAGSAGGKDSARETEGADDNYMFGLLQHYVTTSCMSLRVYCFPDTIPMTVSARHRVLMQTADCDYVQAGGVLYAAKAITCLRSCCTAPDYRTYRRWVTLGANDREMLCTDLLFQKYDALFGSDLIYEPDDLSEPDGFPVMTAGEQ